MMPETCPRCGQPVIPAEIPSLPKIKKAIFDAVRRRPGITAEELRCIAWAHDPSGGPADRKVLHVHVSQLNKLIAPLGLMIRAEGGEYRIRVSREIAGRPRPGSGVNPGQ
jgi:hypothetical protein